MSVAPPVYSPMERVPFAVWSDCIFREHTVTSLHELLGFLHASRATRRLVARVFAPTLRAPSFVNDVFHQTVKSQFAWEMERATELGRIWELARHAPDTFFVHALLWRDWCKRLGDKNNEELKDARVVLHRFDEDLEEAERRLARRDRQLAEGKYGVHRPARCRGKDDKDWTEGMRDKEAHEVQRLKARPRAPLQARVTALEHRVSSMFDQPCTWLAPKGVLGHRMHFVRSLLNDARDYEVKIEKADREMETLKRQRSWWEGQISEAKQKVAKIRDEL